ncbi:hypothetical protein QSV36_19195 [Pseudomonas sp. BCRC 81390]|nr:hypothetical protein [Pseudomonas sp. BCRC 81390]MDM3887701.1 hypothetical protein [Pseudomonas sp. BCRC 81390]
MTPDPVCPVAARHTRQGLIKWNYWSCPGHLLALSGIRQRP